jgi:response regulator RpfG family c-di-GMP phosphodiesterase
MNRRVLLVDDSADFLDGLRQLLGTRFDVRTASGGSEALRLCEQDGPFALVVSDHGMPGMDGSQLLRELRERFPDTVRIMLTGRAELGLAQEALEEGALFRFLTKPPPPGQLLAAVEAGVERHARAAEERLLTEQLAFLREALLGLAESLEERLEEEIGRLDALADFARELCGLDSLAEIAQATAALLERLFGPRTALVRLASPDGEVVQAGTAGLEGSAGPRELLRAGQHELGLLQLAPAGEGAGRRRTLALVAASVALAAQGVGARRQGEEARAATVLALARLAENKDDDTGAHLQRVSEYCRLLARGLCEDGRDGGAIDAAFVSDIALAAPLHDIGKVAIPDAILFKPGKLDASEWEVMRTHAAIGAETLRGVLAGPGRGLGFLRMAHEIAWCHHERWDGGGYPRGLEGAEIPLAARIMALADCYDALTSERPYKHAWPHAEAVAQIQRERGGAFDPDVAAAFLARAELFDGIRRRLADPQRSAA